MTRHLLVGINNNIKEWNSNLEVSLERPRLPLSYIFGAAFYKRGHRLSAINDSTARGGERIKPIFENVYDRRKLGQAMKQVDFALLWSAAGISAIFRQVPLLSRSRKVILASYVWSLKNMPNLKKRISAIAAWLAGMGSRGIVLITREQEESAKKMMPGTVPVLKCTVGIDAPFYMAPSNINEVPQEYRGDIQKILQAPYVIMLGDEQRLNEDAVEIAQSTGMNFVRICQYANSQKMIRLRQEIENRSLKKRFFIFEKAGYPFLRFLLQNASAYAGLVDSTWQPAGWTAACEALASGLPVVLYEGLVSRELQSLGAGEFIKVVPMKDRESFRSAIEFFENDKRNPQSRQIRQAFAADKINLEKTGADFVTKFESLF